MGANGETLLSETFGGEWPDSPLPVWRRLANAAQRYPDKLALACLHQSPNLYGVKSLEYTKGTLDKHLQWSYSQLSSTAALLAAGLQSKGLSSGSSIVTVLKNGVEFPLALWAAHSLACPFVPLNPRTLANAVETRHMLSVANVAAVIVESPESAARFDSIYNSSEQKLLKIVAGETGPDGWTTVADLLDAGRRIAASKERGIERPDSAYATEPPAAGTVTILYTSGTTSLPKGCPHTDRTLNAFMKNLGLGGASSDDIFCAFLPNNHAMGYFYVLHYFCNGAAVVYPSAAYGPSATAQALAVHRCTHTVHVSTALHSLLEWIEPQGISFPHLKDVCLAGSSITPQMMRSVTRKLGSKGVSIGFGMTEGSPIWSAPVTDPEKLIRGDDVICGTAGPGVHVRICAPDSTRPLPRGQPGEIHQSGPGVIAGYIGKNVGTESFYVEDGRTWFRSGDRGVMWPDGGVSIVGSGRYKDMIIRGGENIAPAAIETVLNQFPGVDAQIVGASDPIAGEVPVALVRKFPPGDNPAGQLQEAVRAHMGVLHVPDEVITIDTLGLEDYPRTMSAKVQKNALRILVAAHRRNREPKVETSDVIPNGHSHNDVNGSSGGTVESKNVEDTVLTIWWRATGIEPSKLDKNTPTFNFADSITIMRVRGMYRKELGVTLSAPEMSEHVDLQSQIEALERKASATGQNTTAPPPRVENARSLEEIQVILGSENDAALFKQRASTALAIQGFDFDKDVESVIQTNDFVDVLEKDGMIHKWNFAISVPAEGSTVQELKEALTVTLANNSLFASFCVHGSNGQLFYITMKPQKKLYDQILIEEGSIANVAELQRLAMEYPHPKHSTFPGPLFHALIYYIEDIKSAGLVYYVHHSVHDASSMRLMLEDLNQALLEPARPLRPHVPYQVWADIYHSLRNSPRATTEVNWHVKRLANLHLHRKALFPPARVPRQENKKTPDGIDYGFDAPALLNLMKRHSHITASVVLKAAMALINVTRTKHTHALLSNYEACRSSLPFWPDTLRHIPGTNGSTLADLDASDVAGPTFNGATNLIPIDRSETAFAYLNRLQAEQLELTKYGNAPWRRIISALNELYPGENAGEIVHETHKTFFLTWVPGVLGEYERIKVAKIAIRSALGLVFVAALGGPQATMFGISLRWDAANYSPEETMGFVRDTEKAVLWMLEEKNWGRPLGEFLRQFD
ncbi:acetyl-CoA synthetase-like protein [Bimuria novae-zelandiae CBS 107.79]|uniref:Acetyl-CoA synthetase-like protein n=1 Tax=Bimuria novae-zelandiae CBS 107.79 TaxID=1447943 RepID=A0A6A5V1S5_9PLEO|nr:acetyl-CoA synthetase-like protein [Bimuria novae-zelandiae CBS 107.79]